MSMNDHIITTPILNQQLLRFWSIIERTNPSLIIYSNNILSVAEKSAICAYAYQVIAAGQVDQPGYHLDRPINFEMCRQDMFRTLEWSLILQDFQDVQMNIGFLHMMCLVRNLSTEGPRSVVIARLTSTIQTPGTLFYARNERYFPRAMLNHYTHNDVNVINPNNPNPIWQSNDGPPRAVGINARQQLQRSGPQRAPLRTINPNQQILEPRGDSRPTWNGHPQVQAAQQGNTPQQPQAAAAAATGENTPPINTMPRHPTTAPAPVPPQGPPRLMNIDLRGRGPAAYTSFQEVPQHNGPPVFVRYTEADRRVMQVVRTGPIIQAPPTIDTPPNSPPIQGQRQMPIPDAAWPNGINDVRIRRPVVPPSAPGPGHRYHWSSYANLTLPQIRGAMMGMERFYPSPYERTTTQAAQQARRNMASATRTAVHDPSNYTSPYNPPRRTRTRASSQARGPSSRETTSTLDQAAATTIQPTTAAPQAQEPATDPTPEEAAATGAETAAPTAPIAPMDHQIAPTEPEMAPAGPATAAVGATRSSWRFATSTATATRMAGTTTGLTTTPPEGAAGRDLARGQDTPMDLTLPLEPASSLEVNPPSPREPDTTTDQNQRFNNQEEDDDDEDLTGIEEIHDSEDEEPGMEADEQPQR